ncbi:unnamed protein product, partial [Allacma fusca]
MVNIPFKKDDQQIKCLAHIINLSCQAALNVLKECKLENHPVVLEQRDSDTSSDEEDIRSNAAQTESSNKTMSIYKR